MRILQTPLPQQANTTLLRNTLTNMCNNYKILTFYLLFQRINSYYSTIIQDPSLNHITRNKSILQSSSSSQPKLNNKNEYEQEQIQRNNIYINTLLTNLSNILDRYIIGKLPIEKTKAQVNNIVQLIQRTSINKEYVNEAIRMIDRAGIDIDDSFLKTKVIDRNVVSYERNDDNINARKEWEEKFSTPNDINEFVDDKTSFQNEMQSYNSAKNTDMNNSNENDLVEAEKIASEIIAKSGAKPNTFKGSNLGIGGLDDVLQQIKRRLWVPLSVPPVILKQLGIQPVRGMLLYGKPGCGKTLIGRKIGQLLSPARPITIISGPEIMEKYIGSSEANIRNIFDKPPELYPHIQTQFINNPNLLVCLSQKVLHVIIMDEIDAISRSRGGDNQGDAGIARDSVVNQLLAKMDGVQELVVPTLVIGLTNRRSLMDDALLRAGRFEVQIEVPPPRTTEQRISIFNVHMKHMYEAGRVLVSDAPVGSVAHQKLKELSTTDIDKTVPTYDELVQNLAKKCNKMSGASIASICRAAASHALERAVYDFEAFEKEDHDEFDEDYYYTKSIMNCLVTRDDFDYGLNDVLESMKDEDENSDFNEDGVHVMVKEKDNDE